MLEDDRHCFGCGEKNPIGFKLCFKELKDGVEAEFTPEKNHQGYRDLFHGGLMSLLLDEAMVNAVWLKGSPAVSVEFNVRLRHAVKVGDPIRVRGWIIGEHKRLVLTRAEATDAAGRVLAESEGKCLKMKLKSE
jgi:acyl-coenzyme A thioesterase PaaI-like protein